MEYAPRVEQGSRPFNLVEMEEYAKSQIPPVAFDILNLLIAQDFSHGRAFIEERKFLNALKEAGADMRSEERKGWYSLLQCYRQLGWEATYDQPENGGDGSFSFSAPKH